MTATQNDGFTQTTATGGETTIDFDFLIYGKDDIAFYETDLSGVISLLVRGTDYSIADGELLDPTGGEIVLDPGVYPAGATAGHKFTCISDIAETRSSDFQQGGDFFAQTLNTNLDRLTRVTQQLRRDVDKKAGLPVDSTLAGITFTDAPQDGYGVIWDGVLGNFRNTASSLAVLEGNASTVAANIASINTVASDLNGGDTIGIVAADLSGADNIGTVASLATEIAALGPIAAAITTVAAVDSEVVTVAGIAAAVSTVAGIASAVSNVSSISAAVSTVSGISANVTTVAGIAAAVSNVSSISAAVSTVSGISANVTTVAGISGNVTTVAGIAANVTTVAGISANVTTVAGISSAVSTVATNITAVQTCATNIAAITVAPGYATEAEHWANYPEDSLVPEGNMSTEYSAYHWAQKAALAASGNGAALSVLGVTGNSTAARADIAAASDGQVLRRNGTSLAFGALNLAGANAVTGRLATANIVQLPALSVAGVAGNATADLSSIAAGTDHQVLRRSGTALAFGAVNLAQSAAVTGILPTANGGTANGFFTVSGPASSAKTFTFPNASATVLTTNAAVTVAQGGTGVASVTAYAVICGGTTSTGNLQSVASVGTAGQVLTSNGAGALPSFQNATGGLVKLGTYTGSSVSAVTIGSGQNVNAAIDGTYDRYIIEITKATYNTNSAKLYLRTSTNGGSSFDSGAGNYSWRRSDLNYSGAYSAANSGSATQIELTDTSSSTTEYFFATIAFDDPAGTHRHAFASLYTIARNAGGSDNAQGYQATGLRADTTAINALQLLPSSGNFATITVTLYGVSK